MSNKPVPFQNKTVFNDFVEYWSFAKHLSSKQRSIVFNSLTIEEQEIITNSYTKNKWDDVFYRDSINVEIDRFKGKYGYDLIDIRLKVLSGKSIYIPSKFWNEVVSRMGKYKDENTMFVLGGIKAEVCEKNEKVVLLLPIEPIRS